MSALELLRRFSNSQKNTKKDCVTAVVDTNSLPNKQPAKNPAGSIFELLKRNNANPSSSHAPPEPLAPRSVSSTTRDHKDQPAPDVPIQVETLPFMRYDNLSAYNKSVNNDGYELWTERYRPTKTSEFYGNEQAVYKLRNWLTACWEDFGMCAVIKGPCGVGKTSLVYALAQELGYQVFEINNCTVANPGYNPKKSKNSTKKPGIVNSVLLPAIKKKNFINEKPRLVLIDDVDTMNDAAKILKALRKYFDPVGRRFVKSDTETKQIISEEGQEIEILVKKDVKSRREMTPIILTITSDYPLFYKLKDKVSAWIEMKHGVCSEMLRRICEEEKLLIEHDVLRHLIKLSDNIIRRCTINLEMCVLGLRATLRRQGSVSVEQPLHIGREHVDKAVRDCGCTDQAALKAHDTCVTAFQMTALKPLHVRESIYSLLSDNDTLTFEMIRDLVPVLIQENSKVEQTCQHHITKSADQTERATAKLDYVCDLWSINDVVAGWKQMLPEFTTEVAMYAPILIARPPNEKPGALIPFGRWKTATNNMTHSATMSDTSKRMQSTCRLFHVPPVEHDRMTSILKRLLVTLWHDATLCKNYVDFNQNHFVTRFWFGEMLQTKFQDRRRLLRKQRELESKNEKAVATEVQTYTTLCFDEARERLCESFYLLGLQNSDEIRNVVGYAVAESLKQDVKHSIRMKAFNTRLTGLDKFLKKCGVARSQNSKKFLVKQDVNHALKKQMQTPHVSAEEETLSNGDRFE